MNAGVVLSILLIIVIAYVMLKIIRELGYYRSVKWDFSRDRCHAHYFIRFLSEYFGIAVGLVKLIILASVLIVLITILKDVGGQLMGN